MSLLSFAKRGTHGAHRSLRAFRAGWPGGFDQYSLGSTTGTRSEEFHPAVDPQDPRSHISPLGLREYWYPLLPDKSVGRRRPLGVRLLGEDLVAYRDTKGQVRAALDVCPHRGVRLSFGVCPFKGYVSCGYHGATFDGDGNCVEFITEGPDSKMVGEPQMQLKTRPTVTLKGIVFVWMGEAAPASPQEDLPPELFEDHTVVKSAWRYWHCNWLIALENTNDAHNQLWVHRHSIRFNFNRFGNRPRTPFGARAAVIDNKTVSAKSDETWGKYYADERGKIALRMYYPWINGYWPHHSWRLATAWIFDFSKRFAERHVDPFVTPPEWVGQRIPGMVRNKHRGMVRATMYTRWCVPVEQNITRAFYLHSARPKNILGRLWEWTTWPLVNFIVHFNFSDQDYDSMRTTRYDLPEHLSSTDSILIAMRKTFAEHQRRADWANATTRTEAAESAPELQANGETSAAGTASASTVG